MKKLLSLLVVLGLSNLSAQIAWVNEFHYDNTGADSGEFFEVFLTTGTNVTDISLSIYNGSTGLVNGTHGLGTFSSGASNGFGTFYSKSISGLQNDMEGWALSGTGLTTQFFSYEGSFTAADGPANGMLSVDIGVEETGSTAVGAALGLTGTGSSLGDFSWAAIGTATPGSVNLGQSFSGGAIPEPSTYALIFGGLALGVVFWRKRRKLAE